MVQLGEVSTLSLSVELHEYDDDDTQLRGETLERVGDVHTDCLRLAHALGSPVERYEADVVNEEYLLTLHGF